MGAREGGGMYEIMTERRKKCFTVNQNNVQCISRQERSKLIMVYCMSKVPTRNDVSWKEEYMSE